MLGGWDAGRILLSWCLVDLLTRIKFTPTRISYLIDWFDKVHFLFDCTSSQHHSCRFRSWTVRRASKLCPHREFGACRHLSQVSTYWSPVAPNKIVLGRAFSRSPKVMIKKRQTIEVPFRSVCVMNYKSKECLSASRPPTSELTETSASPYTSQVCCLSLGI